MSDITVARTISTYHAGRRGRWVPILAALLMHACGVSDHSSPSGPTPAVGSGPAALVTVTVSPARLRPGESAAATAVVQTANGAPIAGRTVILTATLGTITPTRGQTDEAGVLTATLTIRPIDAGPGSVAATTDGVTATASICVVTDTSPC